MKKLILMICLGLSGVLSAEEAPKLSAEQALKIAGDYLKENGYAKEHYITGLALVPSSMLKRDMKWEVTWSPKINLNDRKESGLQIAMDGTLTRLVTETARERSVKANRQGSRNMR